MGRAESGLASAIARSSKRGDVCNKSPSLAAQLDSNDHASRAGCGKTPHGVAARGSRSCPAMASRINKSTCWSNRGSVSKTLVLVSTPQLLETRQSAPLPSWAARPHLLVRTPAQERGKAAPESAGTRGPNAAPARGPLQSGRSPAAMTTRRGHLTHTDSLPDRQAGASRHRSKERLLRVCRGPRCGFVASDGGLPRMQPIIRFSRGPRARYPESRHPTRRTTAPATRTTSSSVGAGVG